MSFCVAWCLAHVEVSRGVCGECHCALEESSEGHVLTVVMGGWIGWLPRVAFKGGVAC